jgi:hypothetical protein
MLAAVLINWPIEQIGTADLIDEPKRQRRRRLRLRLAGLDDRELVGSQPGDDIVAPGGNANTFADHSQQPVAGVAPERFVDGLEAVEIDGQNRHGFGSGLRIGEQPGQLLVEHEPVAELGQGVDTRLGQPFSHVVGADQPAAFHRDGLDPERTAARQVDLAIALAVVAAGLRVDQIEQIGSAEQLVEHQIGEQQFAVRPDDGNRPGHAGEGGQCERGGTIRAAGRTAATLRF